MKLVYKTNMYSNEIIANYNESYNTSYTFDSSQDYF